MAGDSGYLVKEIFGPTIQGEGAHAGRACVFLRFAVCNLACSWCDTDFDADGAERLPADAIRDRLLALDTAGARMVVVTGGEPTLQWDEPLRAALAGAGFHIHMESNGTRVPSAPVDWLTVSPKPRFHDRRLRLAELDPDEVKVVVDDSVDAAVLRAYVDRYPRCDRWYAQPCMDADYGAQLARTLELIREQPRWRLSLQLHKIAGVP